MAAKPYARHHWTLKQRLDHYVDKSGGPDACWPWMGARKGDGYGSLKLKRKTWLAHRLAWEVANGPIANGENILHHCDNPPCCNPAHLRTGSFADNARDRAERRRGGDLRGIHNGRAILTENDVLTIRGMMGRTPVNKIAARFGVNRSAVYKIMRGDSWKHVT